MRVHLGSDHAGLDLKAHLDRLAHRARLRAGRPRPVRLRRGRRLPGLLPAGGRGRRRGAGPGAGQPGRGDRRLRQRRADRRQQGRRHPVRAGLVGGDRRARARAQRRPGRLGRRPDALPRGHDPVRRGVPRRRPSAATSGTSAGSASWRRTSRPASCRRCRSPPRVGRRAEPRVPEGHTLHRLATALGDAFAGRPGAREQPAGPVRRVRRAARRPGARGRPRRTASTSSSPSTRSTSCTSTSGCTASSTCTRASTRCPSPSARCGWRLAGADGVRRPARRHRVRAVHARRARGRAGPARPGPAAAGRRPGRRLGADPRAAGHPIGGLLMDQSVVAGIGNVYRAELLYRHRVDPFRPGRTLRARQWREMWDDLVDPDGGRRPHRADRHGAARSTSRTPRSPTGARGAATPTSTGGPGTRAGSAGRGYG